MNITTKFEVGQKCFVFKETLLEKEIIEISVKADKHGLYIHYHFRANEPESGTFSPVYSWSTPESCCFLSKKDLVDYIESL